jgi:hypothetical protein
MRTSFVFTMAIAGVAGCDGQPARAPRPVARPAAVDSVDLPVADNLDYVNWKSFQVGTSVTRKSVTRVGENYTASVETLKLLAANDTEVVVERQNTTERSDGSYKAINPPEKRTYVKSFRVPRGMKVEDLQKPALAAKEVGEDLVTVCGKSVKARVFQWSDRSDVGEMQVRLWLSDEIPGRIVKQEIKVPATKSQTLEEVTEMTVPR